MRIAILAVLLAALAATPARANVEPLPGQTWLVPGDSFVWRASSWPAAQPWEMFSFSVYLDEYAELPASLEIEVARTPDADPDGTLADATVIERYEAHPSARFFQVFSARTRVDAAWLASPGTYYWQASYTEFEDGAEEVYASPVQSLSIFPAPPPDPPQARSGPIWPPAAVPDAPVAAPPPLAPRAARIIVRRAILAATHRRHRGLAGRCTTAANAATCRPSWRDARFRYGGTMHIATGAEGITVAFTGTRVRRACEQRCARPLRWTANL